MNNLSKKKHPIWVIIGLITAIFGGLAAFVAVLNKKTLHKMEAGEGQNNMMHSVYFNNGKIDVKEDTDNVYATSVFGNMDINVPQITEEVLCVEIFNLFGNITLRIPEGINVVYAGENKCANVVSDFVKGEEELTPAVYIIGRNIFSNVKIIKA